MIFGINLSIVIQINGYSNINCLQQLETEQMTVVSDQAKMLYETVLSLKETPLSITNALRDILMLTFQDQSHFGFLLNRVPWFQQPYLHSIEVLLKTIRIYQGKGVEATKVCFNILVQGFKIPNVNQLAVQCLKQIIHESKNWAIALNCLVQNYPHRMCPIDMHIIYVKSLLRLAHQNQQLRLDIIGIIMQNLSFLDNQIKTGDEYISLLFPCDGMLKQLRKQISKNIEYPFILKIQSVLSLVFQFIQQKKDQPSIAMEVYHSFQNKLLLTEKTKIVQSVLFYVAELNKKNAGNLISLLLANIIEGKIVNKKFINSIYYLVSYASKSNRLSLNSLNKLTNNLANFILSLLYQVEKSDQINQAIQNIDLTYFKHKNQRILYLIQCLFMILAYHPTCKISSNSQVSQITKLAKKHLHFDLFIHHDILDHLGIEHEKIVCMPLKWQNKFLPMVLPKLGQKMDKLMRHIKISNLKRSRHQREQNKNPNKKIKKDIQSNASMHSNQETNSCK